jgi:hypothetical protein
MNVEFYLATFREWVVLILTGLIPRCLRRTRSPIFAAAAEQPASPP